MDLPNPSHMKLVLVDLLACRSKHSVHVFLVFWVQAAVDLLVWAIHLGRSILLLCLPFY